MTAGHVLSAHKGHAAAIVCDADYLHTVPWPGDLDSDEDCPRPPVYEVTLNPDMWVPGGGTLPMCVEHTAALRSFEDCGIALIRTLPSGGRS